MSPTVHVNKLTHMITHRETHHVLPLEHNHYTLGRQINFNVISLTAEHKKEKDGDCLSWSI